MAQVIVTFARVMSRNADGGADALNSRGTTEELNSSASSVATVAESASPYGGVSILNNGTGLVWATVDQEPVAAVGTTWPIASGERLNLAGVKPGDKVAVIDDS